MKVELRHGNICWDDGIYSFFEDIIWTQFCTLKSDCYWMVLE